MKCCNFESPPLDGIWSGGALINAPSGNTYLGDFSDSDSLRLIFDDLAPHGQVIVTFDLFAIGAW